MGFRKKDLDKIVNIEIYNKIRGEIPKEISYYDEMMFISSIYKFSNLHYFFPTFRRIEGGFNIEKSRRNFRNNGLRESLEEISESLRQKTIDLLLPFRQMI